CRNGNCRHCDISFRYDLIQTRHRDRMIELMGFTKRYGDRLAVDRLNLKIAAGQMFGFIGPNGAGKSTTIRFLATLLKATSGDGEINGFRISKKPLDV